MANIDEKECRKFRQTGEVLSLKRRPLAALLEEVANNPFRALQSCAEGWQKNNDDHRVQQYKFVAVLHAFVWKIENDAAAREKLIALAQEKSARSAKTRLSLLAAQVMLGAPRSKKNRYEQAWHIARSIDRLRALNIAPQDAPDQLKTWGGVTSASKAMRRGQEHSDDQQVSEAITNAQEGTQGESKSKSSPIPRRRRTKESDAIESQEPPFNIN